MTVGVGVGVGIGFVCGVVVGFGGSYYYMQNFMEKKYEALLQDELASIREVFERNKSGNVSKTIVDTYDNKINVGIDKYEALLREERENQNLINHIAKPYDPEAVFRYNKSSLDRVVVNTSEKAKRDYSTQLTTPLQQSTTEPKLDKFNDVNDEDEEFEDEEFEDEETEDEERKSGIYEITSDEYSDTHTEYDKMGLLYHKYDMILCDEQDELVEDIGHTISDEIEKDLHNRSGTLYVRNDDVAADYEIIIMNSSFSDRFMEEPEVPGIRKRPKDEHIDD